jgi:hypothetical protein
VGSTAINNLYESDGGRAAYASEMAIWQAAFANGTANLTSLQTAIAYSSVGSTAINNLYLAESGSAASSAEIA